MKLGISSILIILSLHISGQTSCERFVNGSFKYKEKPFDEVQIERTSKTQTEHDLKTGLIVRYKITWIGRCEYILLQEWSNNSAVNQLNGTSIHVKIIKTFINGYSYEATDQNGIKSSYTIIQKSSSPNK